MNKILIASIVYSVLAIAGVFFYFNFNEDKEIKIEQGKETIAKLDAALSEDNHADHDHEKNEAGYGHNEEVVAMFQDLEKTLSFFVVVLKEEKLDYFASMFLPEQYSKDLFAYSEDPYKEKANISMLRDLTRDGTLVSAKYDTNYMEEYKTTRQDSEVELILEYKDGKRASLILNFILAGTEHEQGNKIYFIENSIIDLIKAVEEQTK